MARLLAGLFAVCLAVTIPRLAASFSEINGEFPSFVHWTFFPSHMMHLSLFASSTLFTLVLQSVPHLSP